MDRQYRSMGLMGCLAGLVGILPAAAHHSFAAEFDLGRPIELTGTVAEVQWTNPHAWLHIDVTSDTGVMERWSIEMLGINSLVRRGWTVETVSPGDELHVVGFGARDGSNKGNATAVAVAATGEMLWDSANQ